MIQNSMACYPKNCCATFKTATDAMIASAPAGCSATCGANFVPATGGAGANTGATTGNGAAADAAKAAADAKVVKDKAAADAAAKAAVDAAKTAADAAKNTGATGGGTCDLVKVRAREEHEMKPAARRAQGWCPL